MQLNDITLFLKGLAQSLGLPLWAIFIISIGCLIYLYLYGILIPITIIKTRRELTNQRKILGTSKERTNGNYQKQEPKYKWRA